MLPLFFSLQKEAISYILVFGEIYMQEDLISIVVPIYKVEEYLDRCIQSLTNQTYSNLEIILIDDGSPDNCPRMCDDWAKKDDRIKVIHKENGGLSDARNEGLKASTGKYIAFVDSDDFVSINFIKTLYDDLISTHADMSIVGFLRFESGQKIDQEKIEMENALVSFEGLEKFRQLYSIENGVNFVVAWNKLYKTSIFKNNNILYPIGKINEDEFIVHKVLTACQKVCYRNAKMYYYFQRSGSIMHQKYSEKNTHYIDALDQRTEYFMSLDNGLFITALSNLFYHLISDYYLKSEIRDLIESKYTVIFKKYEKDIKNLPIKTRVKIFLFNHFKLPLFIHYKRLKRRIR